MFVDLCRCLRMFIDVCKCLPMFTDVYGLFSHPRRRCHFCYHAMWVGWGGAITFMFTCTHRIGYIMVSFLALGHTHTHTTCCYVVISSLALAQWRDAPLWYLALQAACTILHTHKLDATLWYLLLRVHNLARMLDATLWYVLLCLHNLAHTQTWCYVMIFSLALEQSCTDTWCYVMTSPLALAQSCTHTHTRCCVVISFLGQNLPMDFSATIWPSDNWPTTWKKWNTCRGNFCREMI